MSEQPELFPDDSSKPKTEDSKNDKTRPAKTKSAKTKTAAAKPANTKPAAAKPAEGKTAVTAPKTNVSNPQLRAYVRWAENLPEGPIREEARQIYKQAAQGQLNPKILSQEQSRLQNQIDKAKATSETKPDNKAKATSETKPDNKAKATPETKPDDKAKATSENKPKVKTSKFGYKIYETAKEAKEATPKGSILGSLKKMVTFPGYSPGEPMKKGLFKAAKVSSPFGVAGLIEPAMAVKEAYDKDFKDSEANRKARRATAVYAGQAAGSILGGATLGKISSPTVIGVPLAVTGGAVAGGTAGGGIAGSVYDKFDPPPKEEKLEPSQAPVDSGRDWNEGELDELFEADRQTEELKQRQQDAVNKIPENEIIREERRRAKEDAEDVEDAEVSAAARGPYVDPTFNQDQDQDRKIEEILSPPDPEDSYRRILEMQNYARSNPAANLRKKRIMQAGLDAVETGTFRARRPERYIVVA
jgi:hypothetical protein